MFFKYFVSQRRFPDFTYITEAGGLTEHLDCVIIRWIKYIGTANDMFAASAFVVELGARERATNAHFSSFPTLISLKVFEGVFSVTCAMFL